MLDYNNISLQINTEGRSQKRHACMSLRSARSPARDCSRHEYYGVIVLQTMTEERYDVFTVYRG